MASIKFCVKWNSLISDSFTRARRHSLALRSNFECHARDIGESKDALRRIELFYANIHQFDRKWHNCQCCHCMYNVDKDHYATLHCDKVHRAKYWQLIYNELKASNAWRRRDSKHDWREKYHFQSWRSWSHWRLCSCGLELSCTQGIRVWIYWDCCIVLCSFAHLTQISDDSCIFYRMKINTKLF